MSGSALDLFCHEDPCLFPKAYTPGYAERMAYDLESPTAQLFCALEGMTPDTKAVPHDAVYSLQQHRRFMQYALQTDLLNEKEIDDMARDTHGFMATLLSIVPFTLTVHETGTTEFYPFVCAFPGWLSMPAYHREFNLVTDGVFPEELRKACVAQGGIISKSPLTEEEIDLKMHCLAIDTSRCPLYTMTKDRIDEDLLKAPVTAWHSSENAARKDAGQSCTRLWRVSGGMLIPQYIDGDRMCTRGCLNDRFKSDTNCLSLVFEPI